MKVDKPLTLLGGLTPNQFMRNHWQKKPLLVRQAIPHFSPLLTRQQLFELSQSDSVASRLVVQSDNGNWQLKRGPFSKRGLPSRKTPNWTLLLQSMDLHDGAVRQLLDQFRFVPDARLDDLMISYATPGGGVGPHYDSYDVFLLQAQGTRRWRIGRQQSLELKPGLPLKILENFSPQQTFDLLPGDMLYLPPHYAHDGIAMDECMTYSVGFRAPSKSEVAAQLLGRMGDLMTEVMPGDQPFSDPHRSATACAAQLPQDMIDFASSAIKTALGNNVLISQVLGEYLTEPGPDVWFDAGQWGVAPKSIQLSQKTKMLYFGNKIHINGETLVGSGSDLKLMKKLANQRCLIDSDWALASDDVLAQLRDWCEMGWLVTCR